MRCWMCGREFSRITQRPFCSADCHRDLDAAFDDADSIADRWRQRGTMPTESHRAEVLGLATNNSRSWTGYLPGEAPDPITWEP